MTKPKVVVVDRSRVIINWVTAALDRDYQVVGVTSAMEAPGVVVREEPALVLVEPAMPIVGEDVVPLVRDALNPQALLVLFSSLPAVELAEKARALRAHTWIEKSGDSHTFARRVRSLSRSAEDQPARPPDRAATGDAKTILVAGHHWLTQGTLLPRAGFSMSSVTSAKAVQDSLRAWKPALLVVGPNLPDATVPELCRAIRSDPQTRGVSILFVGESYDQARAQQAREAGANEALLRPLDEMSLFQAVGHLANVATRRSARLLVRIDLQVEQDGEFCVGFTHNISASGMLLETDRELELNQLLTVRFFVPGCSDEIAVHAYVVRVHTRRDDSSVVGVRFDDLPEHHCGVIEEFVHGEGHTRTRE